MGSDSETLNPHHLRRLRITLQHIDNLFSDIEAILDASASKSPFPRYITDVAPGRRKAIESHIAVIRSHLSQVLERQGVEPEPPSIPATRAIHNALSFAQIAIAELEPRHMRGYGTVSKPAAIELIRIVSDLQRQIAEISRHVGPLADEEKGEPPRGR